MNEAIHATDTVDNMDSMAHFHEPLSLLIVTAAAIQGMYRSANIIKDSALALLKTMSSRIRLTRDVLVAGFDVFPSPA